MAGFIQERTYDHFSRLTTTLHGGGAVGKAHPRVRFECDPEKTHHSSQGLEGLHTAVIVQKMDLPRTFIFESAVVIAYMTVWFLVAVRLRRNDVADVAWGLAFVLVGVTSLLLHAPAGRPVLVTTLVAVWGIRLALHIHFRNRGKPEDFRYRKWREEWQNFYTRSYLQVFLFQSVLLILVATPIIYVGSVPNPPLSY